MHSRKLFVKVETSDGSVFDVWFILNVNMASSLINQSGLLEAIHIADHSCETNMHTFLHYDQIIGLPVCEISATLNNYITKIT